MKDLDIVSALLAEERHAPDADAVLAEVGSAIRTPRSRTIATMVGAVVIVIALVGGLTVIVRAQDSGPSSEAITSRPATTGPTITQLAAGHWTTMPAAPLTVRDPAASTWTGTQLIVWGGSDTSSNYADGAAYSPGNQSWESMPASPLSARYGTASAWTGTRLFVWGGFSGKNTNPTPLSDGALYDPTAKAWSTIAPAPVADYRQAAAFWTGHDIVLVTLGDVNDTSIITTAHFAPDTNSWTHISPVDTGSSVSYFATAAAGPDLVLWTMWTRPEVQQHVATAPAGVSSYVLKDGSATWSPVSIATAGSGGIGETAWTGTQLLVGAAQGWCGACPHPPAYDMSGFRLDATLRTAGEIPHGPADDLDPIRLWTGFAWLAFGTTTTGVVVNDGGTTPAQDDGGTSAAWDPVSGTWTAIPEPPFRPTPGAAAVWTDSAVLIWGQLAPATDDATVISTGGMSLT